MRREGAGVGKTDAQREVVEARADVGNERNARFEAREGFAQIGAHVLIGVAPLQIAVVPGETGDFRAQFVERIHHAEVRRMQAKGLEDSVGR